MIDDIRLSVTFFAHRKTKKLARMIGSDGVLSLLRLWSRVAVERPNGILSGWDEEDIAIEGDYPGDACEFVEALVAVGFLDRGESGYALHNWERRQGWVAAADDRAGKARLSKLAQVNRAAYDALVAHGVTTISAKEYGLLARGASDPLAVVGRSDDTVAATAEQPQSDRRATAERPQRDGTAEACEPPAPSPAPSPAHNAALPGPYGPSSAAAADGGPQADAADGPHSGGTMTRKGATGPPPCPHEEIVALYHETLPELPAVKVWTQHRRQLLQARWREDKARQSLDWWREYFSLVRASPFLLGGDGGWRADLEWLIRPRNMPKVLEGRYQGKQQPGPGRQRLSRAGARTASAAREWLESQGGV